MPRRARLLVTPPVSRPAAAAATGVRSLGALAAGLGLIGSATAWAQTPAPVPQAASAPVAQTPEPASPSASETTLRKVTVKAQREEQGKEAYKVNTTTIGKGKRELRDIPQSITVVTEKLLDDRNVDTLKDALHHTAGITFMAAEGGEEDIRLRGFSLAQTGDIFVDGVRDPAFYERDTFNYDRLELLRGSASMLFGRGSTGGAANQVSKVPFLDNANEVNFTLGNHQYKRLVGDFNVQTSNTAALRLNVMATKADNNGQGSSIDKQGIAATYRWNIGQPDEFLASLYYVNNDNGINYGIPWIRPTAMSDGALSTLLPNQKASNYYGMASDYNRGTAQFATLSHAHRFDGESELKSTVRAGRYTRNQRASTIRFAGTTATATNPVTNPAAVDLSNFGPLTVFNRGTPIKEQDLDALYAQSDYTTKLQAWGVQHSITAGVDAAREFRRVFSQRNATTQGGVAINKPTTTVGTPFDGLSVDEGTRLMRLDNEYVQNSAGMYAQDLVQVAPAWKLLGGLRYDYVDAQMRRYDYSATSPTTVVPTANFPVGMTISELSHRFGVLYQPTALTSFHLSYGTSFNTSGDTYAVAGNDATAANRASNTDPEESRNIEVGAKLDSEDGRFTTRLAIFKSTKFRERNTDATSVSGDSYLLSGKRHATGFEMDGSGRLTPQWEVYGSYMWLPNAKVDEQASQTFGNRAGQRPGLTPRHSGTVWTTYQLTEPLRIGAGVNFRSRQSPADIGFNAGTPTTPPTTAAWYAPGYATFDLMAEYAFSSRVILKANINNVADRYYADSLYRGHYLPGVGRIVQTNVTVKF
jgi:catecholate siderophore receptor